MSHATIDYGLYPQEQREAQALSDCKEWFGAKYDEILYNLGGCVATGELTEEQGLNLLSFGGVEGYPADVMLRHAVKQFKGE